MIKLYNILKGIETVCIISYWKGKKFLRIKMETVKLKGSWALMEFMRQMHSESKNNVQNELENALVEERSEYKLL